MTLNKLFINIILIYLSINIFFPKILVGNIPIYPLEFLMQIFVFFFLITLRLKIKTSIEKIYLIFILYCMLSYFISFLITGISDFAMVFKLIKYSFYILMISIAFNFDNYFNKRNILKIIKFQIFFALVATSYVIFHMIFHPISISEMIWGYDNSYRAVGLSGYAINNFSIKGLSHTSVQMGVYYGFLIIMLISLKKYFIASIYWISLLVLVFAELLAYSKSGLIVLLIAFIIYLIKLNIKSFVIIIFIISSVVMSLHLLGYLESVENFGTLGKIFTLNVDNSSDNRRLILQVAAMSHFSNNPMQIFFGVGYNSNILVNLVNYPHLENFIVTIFFKTGLFGLSLIIWIFFKLYHTSLIYSKSINFYGNIMNGYKYFIPGFFIVNMLGGNTFQTDFFAPLFFFIFGISFSKLRKKQLNKITFNSRRNR